MEFDIGGFQRSNRNLPHLPIKDWYNSGEIKLEQFAMPFQIGTLDAINVIRPSQRVVGMKELFYEFVGRYITNLKDPNIKTVVVDTGTLLYEVTSGGFLQEKQDAQHDVNGNLLPKERLLTHLYPPVLYQQVNIRMRGIVYQAKAHNKHLVLTHHASDVYGLVPGAGGALIEGKTGKRQLHGWGQLGDGADVVGYTYWDNKTNKPYFKVELAEVKELEDMVFEEPTYDKINTVIKMIRGEE